MTTLLNRQNHITCYNCLFQIACEPIDSCICTKRNLPNLCFEINLNKCYFDIGSMIYFFRFDNCLKHRYKYQGRFSIIDDIFFNWFSKIRRKVFKKKYKLTTEAKW